MRRPRRIASWCQSTARKISRAGRAPPATIRPDRSHQRIPPSAPQVLWVEARETVRSCRSRSSGTGRGARRAGEFCSTWNIENDNVWLYCRSPALAASSATSAPPTASCALLRILPASFWNGWTLTPTGSPFVEQASRPSITWPGCRASTNPWVSSPLPPLSRLRPDQVCGRGSLWEGAAMRPRWRSRHRRAYKCWGICWGSMMVCRKRLSLHYLRNRPAVL